MLGKFLTFLKSCLLVKGVRQGFVMIWEQYDRMPCGKFTTYHPKGGIKNQIVGTKSGRPYEIYTKDVTISPWEAYFSKEMVAERPLTER